jgi:CubicO group peptidase (beta-lactamase class C family)
MTMLTTAEFQLQRTSPESQGIASSAILQFVEAVDTQLHELHSFMLLRHGCVVAEGWWSPYAPQKLHMLFSLSKSFTSTAVGLAVSEGRLTVDDPVLSFFPDVAPTEVSEHIVAMRVRHLLSMSTGHDVDTMPRLVEQPDGVWTRGFFEVPVVHQPGTHFLYNTGATYMLSAIVQKLTGMRLTDYLKPRLFDPLGIEEVSWEVSPEGIDTGGFGLNIKTEDIARFGQLYLQKGLWQGKQILPEAWIEEATSRQISNGEGAESDWTQGYGYQFWRCRHGGYRGDGAFGQYCIVMPEQDAVLAITGGIGDMQIPMNLVWDILLPAMGANTLPEDRKTQAALDKKLSTLTLLPIQEGEKSSPTAAQVSGQTYRAEENILQVESVTPSFGTAECSVTVKTNFRDETITCGYGEWHEGKTVIFNEPYIDRPTGYVASGLWTDEDTFAMLVRLYETPFFYTLVYRFAGDSLIAESTVNVSFEPDKRTQVVKAQC